MNVPFLVSAVANFEKRPVPLVLTPATRTVYALLGIRFLIIVVEMNGSLIITFWIGSPHMVVTLTFHEVGGSTLSTVKGGCCKNYSITLASTWKSIAIYYVGCI